MTQIDNSYLDTWRGVLEQILCWPNQEVESFVEWITELYPDPNAGLYHEVAGYYVARFAIPARIEIEWKVTSVTGDVVTFPQLERQIGCAIDDVLGDSGSYSDADWREVRRAIQAVLEIVGEDIPTFGHGVPGHWTG